MTLHAVTAEIDRLATIGNRTRQNGTRAVANALTERAGARRSRTDCPLARHLQNFTTEKVRATRYEVFVGDNLIPLNNPPGNRVVLRDFICEFDDHPRRFPHLRAR